MARSPRAPEGQFKYEKSQTSPSSHPTEASTPRLGDTPLSICPGDEMGRGVDGGVRRSGGDAAKLPDRSRSIMQTGGVRSAPGSARPRQGPLRFGPPARPRGRSRKPLRVFPDTTSSRHGQRIVSFHLPVYKSP
ncbi:hypothetical protein DPEC_G00195220 [Dallia pectoralis]|uniref:Uncharacterized protein n=1 Tax=Dallia pectoralis TaxID=75939 RepID=A0ACC2G790_DALPE|nr:hypothetical protein DPEC_G00195220 [Dallia pectoralis]